MAMLFTGPGKTKLIWKKVYFFKVAEADAKKLMIGYFGQKFHRPIPDDESSHSDNDTDNNH